MRAFLVALVLLAGCQSTNMVRKAPTGSWTGAIVPMNHPDQSTPIEVVIVDEEEGPIVGILGPDGHSISTFDVELSSEEMKFGFLEPEEGVAVRCTLALQDDGAFKGRCSDDSGKWVEMRLTQ